MTSSPVAHGSDREPPLPDQLPPGVAEESRVYLLIDIRVTDDEAYARYVAEVRDVVVSHGGEYLVRGGNPVALSGDWQPERIVVIEFKSLDAIERCFGSEEYRALAPLREQSTTSRAVIVRGVPRGRVGNEA